MYADTGGWCDVCSHRKAVCTGFCNCVVASRATLEFVDFVEPVGDGGRVGGADTLDTVAVLVPRLPKEGLKREALLCVAAGSLDPCSSFVVTGLMGALVLVQRHRKYSPSTELYGLQILPCSH